MNEKEIKEEMHRRELPDSIEFFSGTPTTGGMKLKCYTDFSTVNKEDEENCPVQKKVDGLLKIKKYLDGKV